MRSCQSFAVVMPGMKASINSSFSACRTCIRKCWKWFHCHRPVQGLVLVLQEDQDEYTILCLGLSRSGKTTLLQQLVDESPSLPGDPTTGFNIKTIPLSNLYPGTRVLAGKSLSVKEIGGSKAVRPFWSHYYHNKHAILFVVNAAASDQDLAVSKHALSDVLADQRLISKPCLIVGTHCDVDGARDAAQLEAFFSDVMTGRKWSARSCCAFNGEQVKSALEVLIDLILEK